MMEINYCTYCIKLVNTYKSQRSSLSSKDFGFIQMQNHDFFGIGEVSPIHSYGENIDNCSIQINSIIESTKGLEPGYLLQWLNANRTRYFSSVAHAFETALLDYMSKSQSKSLYDFLNLPSPNGRKSCITIPINLSLIQIHELLQKYQGSLIKIKLSGTIDSDIKKINTISERYDENLWIDAEGVFNTPEDCIFFLSNLTSKVLILEDPLSFPPNSDWNTLRHYSEIYVDRYFTTEGGIDVYKKFVDGFNIKPVRFGGLYKSIEVINTIKIAGRKSILGCLLETGVNISNSFALAGVVDYVDLDGYTFFKELPFNGVIWGNEGMHYINSMGNGIK